MNDVPPLPSTPSARDVIELYFDHEPYEGMAKAKQTLFWLAFERASGLMSERVYSQQVWIAAARNGFPYEHARILAEHAYLTFRSALLKLGPFPPDRPTSNLGSDHLP